jgi:DNA (cytosine-5)-methyltransferase 1
VKPRLLDLFSGAGGAGMGYHRAGFEVVGVDLSPQPRYPLEFRRMDALTALAHVIYRHDGWEFDAIHASPPCQAYSIANNIHGRTDHPELITPTRGLLMMTGLPWVIENVPGALAHMNSPTVLCGLTFGLGVKRHRLFESTFPVMAYPCPHGHPGDWVSVFGHTVLERGHVVGKAKGGGNTIRRRHLGTDRGREAMGIDWMTRDELSQAIPPAYTRWIGAQLLDAIGVAA